MKTWKTLMLTGGLALSLLLPLAVHAGPNSTGGPYAAQGDAAPRRQALRERWQNMSPEERQQLRQDFGKAREGRRAGRGGAR